MERKETKDFDSVSYALCYALYKSLCSPFAIVT